MKKPGKKEKPLEPWDESKRNLKPIPYDPDRKIKLSRPLVFFDCETTGLNPQTDRIIQIAGRIQLPGPPDGGWNPGLKFEYILNPEQPIDPEASKIHGFFDDDVKEKPTFKEKVNTFLDIFRNSDWAGFNIIAFDAPLLQAEFARCDILLPLPNLVDAYLIFCKHFPRSLAGAVRMYDVSTETVEPHPIGLVDKLSFENAHDAMADIEATFRVFNSQFQRDKTIPATPEEIYELSKWDGFVDVGRKLRIEESNNSTKIVFNFGKYKNEDVFTIVEKDPQYLEWCFESVFSVDAILTLKKYIKWRKNENLGKQRRKK